MQAVLLSDLIKKARKRADMATGGPVDNVELAEVGRSSIQRLYDQLILSRGQEYYRRTAELNTVAGQAKYYLPDDFYKLIAVLGNPSAVSGALVAGTFTVDQDTRDSPGWFQMRPFEIRQFASHLGRRGGSAQESRYRLGGIQWESPSGEFGVGKDVLEIAPTPGASWSLRIEYIPQCFATLDGADELKFNGINGFEEIVVLELTIYCLEKEESDASRFVRRLEEEWARVRAMARGRDASEPSAVLDTEGLLDAAWGGLPGRAYQGWR